MAVDRVVVEADGGARGNPGPAGYGAVVFDTGTGEVLAEANEAIGRTTNNVAEYRGLIAGLAAARDLGARTVAVRMDSKLVVEQMNGAWKVKNAALGELYREAQTLLPSFDAVSFEWIPRAQNAHADRLANEAMDRAAGKPARVTESPAATAVATSTSAAPAAAAGPSGSWGPPTDRHARLILVRHGSTEHSADRRYSGRNELPLNGVGQAQAAGLAARDFGDVAAVVSSPLRRAVETARAIARATGREVSTLDDLIETDFGSWEGRTAGEVMAEDRDALARWRGSLDVAPPGGESFAAVAVRVERARATLVERHAGESIIVVSHVTPIKLLLGSALRDVEAALFRIHLDTASVSIVDFYLDGNASVRLVNDTSHLPR